MAHARNAFDAFAVHVTCSGHSSYSPNESRKMWQKIKALREERGQFQADMKAIMKTAEDEKRDMTAEESTKFDELHGKFEARNQDISRYERLQSNDAQLADKGEQRAGRDDINTPEQADEVAKEYRSQFGKFLRGASPLELRALTVSGQGVVGPREFSAEIVKAMKSFAGVLDAGAEVITTTDGNPLTIPTVDDTSNTGRLVGEATTNSNTTEPTLGTVTLGAYKFDSDWIKVSIELMRDAGYSVEAAIQQIAAERIGRVFNSYSTTGTGSGQPQGLLGAATVGKTAALNTAISADEIIDLIHSVDSAYRNSGRARFMLSDTLLASLRKLKDENGTYIWAAGLASAPATLFGFPYTVNNDFPGFGANALPIAFGDFSKYKVRAVGGPEIITVKELFASDGLVGFKAIQRLDGKLTDSKAVKTLKLPA